jgi:hypothetical protein
METAIKVLEYRKNTLRGMLIIVYEDGMCIRLTQKTIDRYNNEIVEIEKAQKALSEA